jgi:hypothetical protein
MGHPKICGQLWWATRPLEDPESIQLALSMVLGSIADARIPDKRAHLMLYGLQLAIQNVRRVQPANENSVQDMTINEFGVEVATPQPQPGVDAHLGTPSSARFLRLRWESRSVV